MEPRSLPPTTGANNERINNNRPQVPRSYDQPRPHQDDRRQDFDRRPTAVTLNTLQEAGSVDADTDDFDSSTETEQGNIDTYVDEHPVYHPIGYEHRPQPTLAAAQARLSTGQINRWDRFPDDMRVRHPQRRWNKWQREQQRIRDTIELNRRIEREPKPYQWELPIQDDWNTISIEQETDAYLGWDNTSIDMDSKK
ncbi:hypothetical protein BCR43DRAFT_551899 [Syncephalastrum racemosum]|uniref:Uncharacterized protein n=1 Tax=Syncephalastrum racemosum TaxID=13706 RepID=A0A1X2H6I5_SYNRA|nr:hypothetical protein BCR43DRAFT_551899 [Syncephalastrum racemosum]